MPVRVTEFHNIMPLENLRSVLRHGILSHERARKLTHSDISLPDIQERRERIKVPGGRFLHQYANLYFHARNPMMFRRQDEANDICVLRVSTLVLNLPGTVITDRNASADFVRFLALGSLNQLPLERIYAEDWRHPNNLLEFQKHKKQKCAEVLVPDVVLPEYITGIYVVRKKIKSKLVKSEFPLPIKIHPNLFFR
jgi:hypothetical protein